MAFVRDWRLALVLLCLPAALIATMGGLGAIMERYQERSTTGFAKTGSFAEEVISCIRNVTAFGSQHLMLRKYTNSLTEPAKDDFMAKMMMGLLVANVMFIFKTANGLAVGYPSVIALLKN